MYTSFLRQGFMYPKRPLNSLCIRDWPWTLDLPASYPQVLALQVCPTVSGSLATLPSKSSGLATDRQATSTQSNPLSLYYFTMIFAKINKFKSVIVPRKLDRHLIVRIILFTDILWLFFFKKRPAEKLVEKINRHLVVFKEYLLLLFIERGSLCSPGYPGTRYVS